MKNWWNSEAQGGHLGGEGVSQGPEWSIEGEGVFATPGVSWQKSSVAFLALQHVVPDTPLSHSERGNQSGLENRDSVPVSFHESSGSGFPKSNSAPSLPSGLDYWV